MAGREEEWYPEDMGPWLPGPMAGGSFCRHLPEQEASSVSCKRNSPWLDSGSLLQRQEARERFCPTGTTSAPRLTSKVSAYFPETVTTRVPEDHQEVVYELRAKQQLKHKTSDPGGAGISAEKMKCTAQVSQSRWHTQ